MYGKDSDASSAKEKIKLIRDNTRIVADIAQVKKKRAYNPYTKKYYVCYPKITSSE